MKKILFVLLSLACVMPAVAFDGEKEESVKLDKCHNLIKLVRPHALNNSFIKDFH